RATAGGNLLRGGGFRRTGRGPLQLRPVRVGAWPETRRQGADLTQIAGDLQAALLGGAVGYPLLALVRCRLGAPVPFRLSLLSLARAGAVSDFPADERRGVFRASAGRAEVHRLPAADQSAVRDHHRFGRKADHWGDAVSNRAVHRRRLWYASPGRCG